MKKQVIIWGAGKIGRGFAAEIFWEAGYKNIFIDTDDSLIRQLNRRGKYTIHKLPSAEKQERIEIDGYKAISTLDEQLLEENLLTGDLIVMAVFASAFTDCADILFRIINRRAIEAPDRFLDILILCNAPGGGSIFRKALQDKIHGESLDYFINQIGIVESIVLRMAVNPIESYIRDDPLAVVTNGYPRLTVNGNAFKGKQPVSKHIEYSTNFGACEKRKLYTYNMVHALFAYSGFQKGLHYVDECLYDREIMERAKGALDEIGRALMMEYGFSGTEMDVWNKDCLRNMTNPLLKDTLKRVGADPVRKLKAGDRLAGPALLCRDHGIEPKNIAAAIADGFLYDDPEDVAADAITRFTAQNGIEEAVKHFCGFTDQPELVKLVAEIYKRSA
jgi:mannitol-1-phosphate 5-dehydrogenase